MLGGDVKQSATITLLLMFYCHMAFSNELPATQKQCLKKIREEVSFILSGIETVNQQYEEQLRARKLANFTSGDYSTNAFLDKSIRKYRMDITGKVRSYPQQYKNMLMKENGKKHCIVNTIQNDAIGIIHAFEISWQQTIEKADKNRKFFQSIDNLK